jgi:hypothetical protein
MKVTLKQDANGEVYFDLNDLKDTYNIKRVAFYTVDANEIGGVTVKLYDKNKKIVHPKKPRKTKKKVI